MVSIQTHTLSLSDTHKHTHTHRHIHSHKHPHTHKDYSQKKNGQTEYKDRTGWMAKCNLSCLLLILSFTESNLKNEQNNNKKNHKMSQLIG